MLDLEPGFASSIWPAAGIGSASLLIWGPRLWPACCSDRSSSTGTSRRC
jgi:hypothetical protein